MDSVIEEEAKNSKQSTSEEESRKGGEQGRYNCRQTKEATSFDVALDAFISARPTRYLGTTTWTGAGVTTTGAGVTTTGAGAITIGAGRTITGGGTTTTGAGAT